MKRSNNQMIGKLVQLRPMSSLAIDLSSVKREDVVSCSDAKWMSSFVRQVGQAGDSSYTDAIDEYHRKQFRKISKEDAIATLRLLGEHGDDGKPWTATSLHGSFWLWETIEEAIAGQVDELSAEDYQLCFSALMANLKGSTNLVDEFETRMYRENTPLF